jgi:hypothetical protein
VDVEGHVGRLFQDLAVHFGKDAIFMGGIPALTQHDSAST